MSQCPTKGIKSAFATFIMEGVAYYELRVKLGQSGLTVVVKDENGVDHRVLRR